MKIYDFEYLFGEDILRYFAKRPKEMEQDDLDEKIRARYELWLSEPKDWLGGKTPKEYFDEFNDIQIYLSMLVEYSLNDMEVPGYLMDCIVRYREAEKTLTNMLKQKTHDLSASQRENLHMNIVDVITQGGYAAPQEIYLDLICAQDEVTELTDYIVEILLEEDVDKELVYSRYEKMKGSNRLPILEIISNFSGDERACDILIKEFCAADDDILILTSMLKRLGNERAVPPLKQALEEPFLDYLAYVEICHCIESLTGETLDVPDFSGDEIYDFLADMAEEQEDDEDLQEKETANIEI